MTAPTISTPGVDELTLPNHPETKVWLKRKPTWGNKNLVDSFAFLARKEIAPGRFAIDGREMARYFAERTLVMIHDWTVTDESGKRAAVTIEALEALDSEDGAFIEAEARKRYDGSSSPLGQSSDPSSTTGASSPATEPSESPA